MEDEKVTITIDKGLLLGLTILFSFISVMFGIEIGFKLIIIPSMIIINDYINIKLYKNELLNLKQYKILEKILLILGFVINILYNIMGLSMIILGVVACNLIIISCILLSLYIVIDLLK